MLTTFSVGAVSGLFMFRRTYYSGVSSYAQYLRTSLPRHLREGMHYIANVGAGEIALSLIFLTIDRFVHIVLPQRFVCQ